MDALFPFTPDDDYQTPAALTHVTPGPRRTARGWTGVAPWTPNDHYQLPPEVLARHIRPPHLGEPGWLGWHLTTRDGGAPDWEYEWGGLIRGDDDA
jgi:hypothetical protein